VGHIAIKLNPAGLVNPDLDMRYRIPDLIRDVTEGRIRDDGYDDQTTFKIVHPATNGGTFTVSPW
jgi:hypothetical protein